MKRRQADAAALPAHRDPAVIAPATEVLRDMKSLAGSLRSATVLTDDGFEVVSIPPKSGDGRLASMASSVQALAEGVANELSIGDSRYVVLAAESGHVVQLRIPGHPLVLAALYDVNETLGTALSTSRLGADRLAAALAGRPESDGRAPSDG